MYLAGWLAGLALLIGVVLTWLGLRGRRVDNHPICRRCRRDLFGLGSDSAACPECGADLTTYNIRTGTRVRRSRFIYVGATLAVLGLLALTPLTMTLMLGARANGMKPLWLLMWESARYLSEDGRRRAVRRLHPFEPRRASADLTTADRRSHR